MERAAISRYRRVVSHLYVMQNHVGFIKIGRSVDVEARRKALEVTNHCSIAIVAVVKDAGEFEETMHLNLGDFRVIGEWFENDELARACVANEIEALSEAVGRKPPKLVWTYDAADEGIAEDWLKECELRRTRASIDKEYGRLIRDMARNGPPTEPDDRFRDTNIWTAIWRFENQERTICECDHDSGGQIVLTGYRTGNQNGELVPHYTRDVEAAMLLWPDGLKPDVWSGTAWECCIAALKARKAALKT